MHCRLSLCFSSAALILEKQGRSVKLFSNIVRKYMHGNALGQKTIEMARHYSRSADKSKKVEAAVIRLGARMNKKSTLIVKLFKKVLNFVIGKFFCPKKHL